MSGSSKGSVVQPLNERSSDGSTAELRRVADEDPYLADLLRGEEHAALAAADPLAAALVAHIVQLVRLAVSEYVVTREQDGACAGCYLARLGLALEGHGWELGQQLKEAVHGDRCRM